MAPRQIEDHLCRLSAEEFIDGTLSVDFLRVGDPQDRDTRVLVALLKPIKEILALSKATNKENGLRTISATRKLRKMTYRTFTIRPLLSTSDICCSTSVSILGQTVSKIARKSGLDQVSSSLSKGPETTSSGGIS